MSISAINCSPIKPQVVDFKGKSEFDYDKFRSTTDKINDSFVKRDDDIKSPVNVLLSIGIALAGAYGAGKAIGLGIGALSPKVAVGLESGLKNAANVVKTKAVQMQTAVPKSNIHKYDKIAGSLLEKAEELAHKGYKKIAYSGIAKNVVNPERATQAMANALGFAFGAKTAVDLATKDRNGDGVKDIMQKSQNFYTGTKTAYGKTMDKLDAISSLISLIV